MAGRSRALRIVVAGVVAVLVLVGALGGLAAHRSLTRVPESIIVVRVGVHGGPRAAIAAGPTFARYLAAKRIWGVNDEVTGRGEPPAYETTVRAAYPRNGDVVYRVPLRLRSVREETLWQLRIPGLPNVLFGDGSGVVRADSSGRATLTQHARTLPEIIDVDTRGLRELDLHIDLTAVAAVTLTLPSLPEEDDENAPADGDVDVRPVRVEASHAGPTLVMRPSSTVSIALAVTGLPPQPDCLRAVVVSYDQWTQVFGDRMSDEAPRELVTMAEWRTLRGFDDRRYTMTVAADGRSATLAAPSADRIYGNVPSWVPHDVYAAVACIVPGASQTSAGIVRVSLAD